MWIFNQTRLFSLWHEIFVHFCRTSGRKLRRYILVSITHSSSYMTHLTSPRRSNSYSVIYSSSSGFTSSILSMILWKERKKKHCGLFEKVSRISLMCYWAHIVPLIVFTDNWNLHRSCQWHALVKIMWRWYCHNLVTIKSLLSYLSYFHNQITDFHNVHYIKDELLTDIWPHIN